MLTTSEASRPSRSPMSAFASTVRSSTQVDLTSVSQA